MTRRGGTSGVSALTRPSLHFCKHYSDPRGSFTGFNGWGCAIVFSGSLFCPVNVSERCIQDVTRLMCSCMGKLKANLKGKPIDVKLEMETYLTKVNSSVTPWTPSNLIISRPKSGSVVRCVFVFFLYSVLLPLPSPGTRSAFLSSCFSTCNSTLT